MKLVAFHYEGNARIGNVFGEKVVDLNYACQAWLQSLGKLQYEQIAEAYVPADMVGFLYGGEDSIEMAAKAADFALGGDAPSSGWKLVHDLKKIRLEAPVSKPGEIICVGHNYREHIMEMGREHPVIFAKYAIP